MTSPAVSTSSPAAHMARLDPISLRQRLRSGDAVTRSAACAEIQRRLRPASAEWLGGRIGVLLSHSWTPDDAPSVRAAIIGDWLDVLDGLSEDGVAEACRRYLGDPANRGRRPFPGQIADMARQHERENREALRALEAPPPSPQPARCSPERRAAIMAEVQRVTGARSLVDAIRVCAPAPAAELRAQPAAPMPLPVPRIPAPQHDWQVAALVRARFAVRGIADRDPTAAEIAAMRNREGISPQPEDAR